MLPALVNIVIYQVVWGLAVVVGNRELPFCCLLFVEMKPPPLCYYW